MTQHRAVVETTEEDLKKQLQEMHKDSESLTDSIDIAKATLRAALFKPFMEWCMATKPTPAELVMATGAVSGSMIGQTVSSLRLADETGLLKDINPPREHKLEVIATIAATAIWTAYHNSNEFAPYPDDDSDLIAIMRDVFLILKNAQREMGKDGKRDTQRDD